MNECVFIGWSGDQELAIEIKNILDNDGYHCFVGGEYIGNPMYRDFNGVERGAINKTVRSQMNCCNHAIVLIKKEIGRTQISGNLSYEIGFLTAKYPASNIHIFYIDFESSADNAIPSDMHGSWGTIVSTKDKSTNQVANEIASFFLKSKNAKIYESKMKEIDCHRHTDYALDVHLDNPVYSHYEMAKHLLFYVQATFIYQEWKDAEHKCRTLNERLNQTGEITRELSIALEYALLTFKLFDASVPDEGKISLSGNTFRKMYRGYKALTSLLFENKKNEKFDISNAFIKEDNSRDEFTNWLILQIQQHVTFLFFIFFNSEKFDIDNNETRVAYLNDAIKIGLSAIKNVEIIRNNFNEKYADLLLGYIYRNLATFYDLLNEKNESKYYQDLSCEMREDLYKNMSDESSWNVQLRNYIELEYFLQTLENIENIDDKNERIDAIEDANDYIQKIKRYNDNKQLTFSRLVEMLEKAKKSNIM